MRISGSALALMLLVQFGCSSNRNMTSTDTASTSGNANEPVVIVEETTVATAPATTDTTSMTANNNDMAAGNSGVVVYFNEAQPANLGGYRTFSYVMPIQGMGDKTAANDPMYSNDIQQALNSEFQKRGYQMAENDGDLLVNYYVFKEPTRLTGTNTDDFADFRWNPNDLRTTGDTQVYTLDPGTVLVQLADRNTGKLVWQGYATGLTDGDISTLDQDKVKQAVVMIFDKFNYQANK